MIFMKIFKTSLIRGMTRGWIVLFILFSCRFFARNHRRTSGIASRVRWGEILVWINYILDSQISYLLIQALGLIFFKTFRRSSSIRKKSKPTVNYLLSSKELSYLSSEIYKLVSSKPSEFYEILTVFLYNLDIPFPPERITSRHYSSFLIDVELTNPASQNSEWFFSTEKFQVWPKSKIPLFFQLSSHLV